MNMFQTADLSINCRFTYANFTLSPEDPRSGDVDEVRGSFLTGSYLKARVGPDKFALIEYVASDAKRVSTSCLRSLHHELRFPAFSL